MLCWAGQGRPTAPTQSAAAGACHADGGRSSLWHGYVWGCAAAWHTQAAVTVMLCWLLLQQLPQSTACTCQPDFQRALSCYFNAVTAAAVLPAVLS